MKDLKDLIGKQFNLTFRSKSMSQFKGYKVLGYADGFIKVLGIEANDTRPSTVIFWQNVSEIDTIVEQGKVKPVVPVKPVVWKEKELTTEQVAIRSKASQNKLLGMSK